VYKIFNLFNVDWLPVPYEREPCHCQKQYVKKDHRHWVSEVVMIRYIKNIDISFLISIYCIVLYRRENIKFSIYRDILRQKYIFLLLHCQNN